MCDLKGRAAIVTGGAQGIGFGIALELARAGCRVVLADRDLERASASAAQLRSAGHEAIASRLDVTDEQSVRDGMQAAPGRFGGIDILVNNAGIHCEKIGEVSRAEHFEHCLQVNLIGVWRVTQSLLPHFKARGGGKIVNIASVNGRKAWADTPAYSASKAGVINLTQSLATTLGPYNINVNAVCPGGVITAMAEQFNPDRAAMQAMLITPRPLKRPLLPEDVGQAVVFFASEHARNITGQALNVDCGEQMN
jgi:NAD(P)-dependent dehydrogenase (short-subunit alcohol dehydrogenase family)